MRIDEVMTRFPTTVRLGESTRRAATLVAASEIGQLMVLDADDRFVGVLSEGDLLRALLPGPEELRAAGGTVASGFVAFLTRADSVADRPIDDLVVQDPVAIGPGDAVAAAAVVMTDHGLRRLPVVAEGRLVGTVSRIDVCRAVLAAGNHRTPRRPASDPPPAAGAAPPTAPAPATAVDPAPASAVDPASAAAAAAARIAAARERLAAGRFVPGTPPPSNGHGRV